MKKLVNYINSIAKACNEDNDVDTCIDRIFDLYESAEDKELFVMALCQAYAEQKQFVRLFARMYCKGDEK